MHMHTEGGKSASAHHRLLFRNNYPGYFRAGSCATIQKGPLFPKQRWARVHCTLCTPFCYDTGYST